MLRCRACWLKRTPARPWVCRARILPWSLPSGVASTDPVAKVADFYKAALAKQGWNTPQSLLTGDSALLSGEKDGKQVSIAISRQDDKTNAVLSVPND